MAFTKYVLPALSVAATSYAASCSNSATMTISAPAGASALAACQTYTGDVVIQSGASTAGILDLGDIEKISGSLAYAEDDQVNSIKAGSLASITDALNLTDLIHLSTLSLTSLRSAGDMTMIGLGALQSFDFGSGLEEAGVITIQNTQIQTLNGINTATQLGGLRVSNNVFLSNVGLNISKVGVIDIGPDADDQTADFPNLMSATSLTFRNCSEVKIPSLGNVSQTLGLYSNTYQSFSAANLSTVGALVFNDNSAVTNFSFPKLTVINGMNGTLQIANNSKLTTINGFPGLTSINGGMDLSGNFDNVTLNKLNFVKGATTIDTSSSKFDCNSIKSKGTSVLRGAFNCTTKDENPTSTNGDGTTDTSGSGGDSSSSSSSVAFPLEIPSFWAGSGVLVGLLGLLM